MATPSRAELEAQLSAIIHWFETLRETAEDNAENLVGLEEVIVAALESDFPDSITAGIAEARAAVSSALEAGQLAFDSHLQDWGRFLGIPATDPQEIIDALYEDFQTAGESVQTRGFTFGTPTPNGANAGDGEVLRLTVDAFNFDIENATPEAKRLRCIRDQNSGAEKGREVFLVEGATPSRDQLESLGSGERLEVEALHPSQGLLLNPSFADVTIEGGFVQDIGSWTSSTAVIGDGTDYDVDTTNFYLPARDDDETRQSLVVKLTRTLSQKLSVRRTSLVTGLPAFLQVAYEGVTGGATGTLQIEMGTQTVSVAVGAADPWTVLRIPLDQNSWFENFNEDDLAIRLNWTRTGGELRLSDVMFFSVPFVDGTGLVVVPGQTPFLARHPALPDGDEFTFTDTATESVIQRWINRRYRRYLPHSATPTIPDP